jgi:type III restriction enzyme
LCDQPPTYSDEDEGVAYQEKRASLIEKTLVPVKGVVTVTFELNSVTHVVRRSSETKELKLKIGSDEFRECTEGDVRNQLPVQAYSQKQLSAVGTRANELTRFIRAAIKCELDKLGHEIDERKVDIKGLFAGLVRRRKLQRDLDRDTLELASLTQRVESLRKELKGVALEDRQVLECHEPHLREEQFVEKLGRELGVAREMAADFRRHITGLPSKAPAEPGLPNAGLLEQVRAALAGCIEEATRHIDAAIRVLDESSPKVTEYGRLVDGWKARFAAHQTEYDRAKQAASAHESQFHQITQTEEKIKALRTEVDEKQEQLKLFDTQEEEFRLARREWDGAFKTRADLMQVRCQALTQLSTERIRANIERGVGVDKVKARLLGLLQGTGVRTKKVDDLCDSVAKSADPLHAWAEVVDELEKFVDYSGGEVDQPRPRETPHLTAAGFTPKDLDRVASRLTPDEWVELCLTELEDVPRFEYRQSEGLYIQFSDASAGQQATALLRVLLSQEGPPLLIDQPEEDLDNQVIQDVVNEIWQAKRVRQIVFSSHNPNIVVNGDADLVVCCDYRTAGDHSGGQIKLSGAIDMEEIKREITVVMEGGRDAFRLRKEKYGF